MESMIATLERVVAQRRAERPEDSYTAYLFGAGRDKILKKIGEEAAETIIASKNDVPEEIIAEASDLIYHLLVLLAHHDLPFSRIEAELARRHLENER